MTKYKKPLLTILSLISGFLPIIFFLLFFNRNNGEKLWVIFLYTILSPAVDYFNSYANISETTYFYSTSLFTVLEFGLFSIYFYFTYRSKIIKQLLIISSVIFLGIAIYNLFFDASHHFDSLPTSAEEILIICYSIFYFYEELKVPENTFIYSTKTFWVVIAILLYVAGTFILFVSTVYMTKKEQEAYWPINNIANIAKNILLAIAFILKVQPKNKYTQNIYNF